MRIKLKKKVKVSGKKRYASDYGDHLDATNMASFDEVAALPVEFMKRRSSTTEKMMTDDALDTRQVTSMDDLFDFGMLGRVDKGK
jgi:hypothetical protein